MAGKLPPIKSIKEISIRSGGPEGPRGPERPNPAEIWGREPFKRLDQKHFLPIHVQY